jgi:hypothetical protein
VEINSPDIDAYWCYLITLVVGILVGVIAESVPKRTLSSEQVSKIILLLPAIKRARVYVGLLLIRGNLPFGVVAAGLMHHAPACLLMPPFLV